MKVLKLFQVTITVVWENINAGLNTDRINLQVYFLPPQLTVRLGSGARNNNAKLVLGLSFKAVKFRIPYVVPEVQKSLSIQEKLF